LVAEGCHTSVCGSTQQCTKATPDIVKYEIKGFWELTDITDSRAKAGLLNVKRYYDEVQRQGNLCRQNQCSGRGLCAPTGAAWSESALYKNVVST